MTGEAEQAASQRPAWMEERWHFLIRDVQFYIEGLEEQKVRRVATYLGLPDSATEDAIITGLKDMQNAIDDHFKQWQAAEAALTAAIDGRETWWKVSRAHLDRLNGLTQILGYVLGQSEAANVEEHAQGLIAALTASRVEVEAARVAEGEAMLVLESTEQHAKRIEAFLADSRAEVERLRDVGVSTELFCPNCGEQHVDEGEWASKPHRTHRCAYCGHEWRPYPVATYGIRSERRTSEGK